MAAEVKYQHPAEPSLVWSGKGRQPKWVEAFLASASGRSLVELEVGAKQRGSADDEIDLGINDGHATQSLADVATPGRAVIDAQNQSGALTRPTEPPEAGQQQLEVCLQEFGFQSLTAEEFIQAGIDEFNQAMVRTCRAGVAFWAAQEALKAKSTRADLARTAGMDELISSAGLPKQRVYECIAVAKFYSRLPEENRAKALSLGKKHALLLASLPQEVIDRAAASGNDLIEKADLMTVAELKEEIKAMRRREKNYEAELERTQGQVNRLLAAKTRTTDFLLRTEEVREECMALQLGAELHLNSLHKLFDETDAAAPEGRWQLEQIWITAHTVAARALDLVQSMKDHAPDDMPDRVLGTHILSVAEAERWLLDYPTIENRYAAEQAKRQEKREAARPKGPGRPKGSANKGGEE